MKRFGIIFFTICAALILFGCSENNPTGPEVVPNEQSPDALAKRIVTTFTGTSNFVQPLAPGTTTILPNGNTLIKGQIAEWYDAADDPQVTGQSIWYINKNIKADGTGKAWGKADINVEGDLGKWKISWHGNVSATGVVAYAVGVGKEGSVKGLVAKWTYTMIFANGIFYTTEGHIKGH